MSDTPAIKEFMTLTPRTIGEDIPLSKALQIMKDSRIRHLPVQYGGKLVGVLSDRDIKFALSIHPSAKDLKVGDIMTEEPFAVSPNIPVDEVFAKMSRKKYGCVVIKNEKGRAIGIFTAVDALRVLSDVFRNRKLPAVSPAVLALRMVAGGA